MIEVCDRAVAGGREDAVVRVGCADFRKVRHKVGVVSGRAEQGGEGTAGARSVRDDAVRVAGDASAVCLEVPDSRLIIHDVGGSSSDKFSCCILHAAAADAG